jgi:hypothetical protein
LFSESVPEAALVKLLSFTSAPLRSLRRRSSRPPRQRNPWFIECLELDGRCRQQLSASLRHARRSGDKARIKDLEKNLDAAKESEGQGGTQELSLHGEDTRALSPLGRFRSLRKNVFAVFLPMGCFTVKLP